MSVQGTVVKYLFGKRSYAVVSSEEANEDDDDDDDDDNDKGLDRGKCEKKVDIPTDAYGAAILALVRDVPRVFHPQDEGAFELGLWSCAFAGALLFVNFVLQCSILAFVYHYVVSLDIAHVQNRYKDFRANVFSSEGEFQEELWDTYKGRAELCQIVMWNTPFYYSILFCWSLVMMIEIRKSEELIRHLMSVPLCAEPRQMLIENDERQFVVAFTRCTRFWILVLVGVPKMGICVSLLLLGCEWLSATMQFESLVMNTVAMEFIVQLDEILFEAVLPMSHRRDVEEIDFLLERDFMAEAELTRKHTMSYRKSLFYLFGLLVFVVLYAEYLQDVLPTEIRFVRDKCQEVIDTDFRPPCSGWTWYLRGRPSAFQCFPLPTQDPVAFVPN